MTEKPTPMTEDKLNAFLDNELRQTIGFGDGADEIATERRKNLEMYLNRPVGDEEDGKSKMQDSTVQDVIEALLPQTLAPFISAEDVFEFKPVSKEDKEYSEVAGKYINHIVMVDNDGTKLQYVWQKDALLQKNGFVYADWVERKRTEKKQQRVDYYGLKVLTEDPEIKIIQYIPYNIAGQAIDAASIEALMQTDDPLMGVEFEVEYRRTWKEGRVKIENIPPECVIISSTAKDAKDSRVLGWFGEVTISQLREEGYPEEKIAKLATDQGYDDTEGERLARTRAQGGLIISSLPSTDPSTHRVWRSVIWTMVDYDGDGIAEMRKIVRAGDKRSSGGVILHNEEADEALMVDFTPIIMPHQAIGRCPADQAREIQSGKTFAMRMANDIIAHTAHPRYKFKQSSADDNTWDDLMTDIAGAPIRMNELDAIEPLRDAPDLGPIFQQLEYFDRLREVRTPVTRQDQGIDADVLNTKTATDARIQANATAQKKELILRLYAESLGRLARMINRLVIKHQDKPRLLRLYPNQEPIEIDPRFWNADMDVAVRVGLGTGTRDQQMQSLMMINQIQMDDLQLGLPTVNPELLYNTRARLVEFSGLSTPELYFSDPKINQQGGPQGIPPEQVQQAQAQAFEEGKKAGVDQVKVMDIEAKERMQQRELALKSEELKLEGAELRVRQQENQAQAMGYPV